MKKVLLASLIATTLISGCGGGGGGSSSSGDTNNSAPTSNFFDKLIQIDALLTGSFQGKSNGSNSYSSNLNSTFCSTQQPTTQANIEMAKASVTTVGENYACGPFPSDKSVTQCMYVSNDGLHDRRSKNSDFESTLEIDNGLGKTTFSLLSVQGLYEYTVTSENKVATCSTSPSVNYSLNDIVGNWMFKAVSLVNNIPTTLQTGAFSCTSNACQGDVKISSLLYTSSNQSWDGQLEFQGLPYKLTTNISPDKQNLSVLACPNGVAPSDYAAQCVILSAHK